MENNRILISFTVISITTVAFFWWKRHRNTNGIPTQWKAIGKVSDLHMYPLKGGKKLELIEGNCTSFGLEEYSGCDFDKGSFKLYDRAFIIYHETNFEYRGAKHHPKIILIEVSNFNSIQVKFDAPNMSSTCFQIPDTKKSKRINIEMHDNEKIEVIDCGDYIASWISKYVLDKNSGLRVGYRDNCMKDRTIYKSYQKFYPDIKSTDVGILTNLTTYMLVNKASVNDLNTKLDKKVDPCQFRPNIVVDNVEGPYVEDNWNWIKIGKDVIFRNVRPCTRCIFINVDPETGTSDSKQEPLKTLKKYRQLSDEEKRKACSNSPVMGINLGIRKTGIIKVNDIVYVA